MLIVSCGILVTMATSCAKECRCTLYEDGKKIGFEQEKDYKYYDKDACENRSLKKPYEGPSVIVDGKKVTIDIKCKLH